MWKNEFTLAAGNGDKTAATATSLWVELTNQMGRSDEREMGTVISQANGLIGTTSSCNSELMSGQKMRKKVDILAFGRERCFPGAAGLGLNRTLNSTD